MDLATRASLKSRLSARSREGLFQWFCQRPFTSERVVLYFAELSGRPVATTLPVAFCKINCIQECIGREGHQGQRNAN